MRRSGRGVDSPMDGGTAMSFPIELLRCPISGQPLKPAPDEVVCSLQQLQRAGTLRSRGDGFVEPFEAGLVTADGVWFYPVRSEIPVLLASEAVAGSRRNVTI